MSKMSLTDLSRMRHCLRMPVLAACGHSVTADVPGADKRALDSSGLAAIAEEPACSNLQRPAGESGSEEDLDDIQLAD